MTDKTPVFDGINLVVKDMEATVAFYRRLGLQVDDTDPAWQAHHRRAETSDGATFDFDSETFAQQYDAGWQARGANRANGGILGFRLASREAVDDVFADLTAAGYAAQQSPYNAFWGARYAIVEDPDGNAVGLMSPSDPARRSTPTPP